MKKKYFFLLLLLIVSALLFSQREIWEAKENLVPYEFINFLFPQTILSIFQGSITANELDQHLIIAEKKYQHAALYRFENIDQNTANPQPSILERRLVFLNSYQISTGKADGNKLRRGDLKTPEGLYIAYPFFSEQNLRRRYGAIAAQYGTGAWELGYPNELDRLRQKTGSGIWIHGTDVDMTPNDTEGCIRFENEIITYFHEVLNFSKTPVIINDVIEWVNIDFLKKEIENIEFFLTNWLTSWINQDITEYLSFYSSDEFISHRQRMNFEAWENHKKRIFNPDIQLEIVLTDYSFYYADNLVLVSFDQEYSAPNLKNSGRKQIVLRRQNPNIVDSDFELQETIVNTSINPEIRDQHSTWKIIQEEWTAR
ncbi:MAG: L,D-transpeptidase family protein [Candidatus Cloacimonetes bacterium]|nr:L,D-transpeptidase family protein [Candidatus Cloacimonadota bacterium]